jgi:glycosyltransferase involved in cell wall biosynthesis
MSLIQHGKNGFHATTNQEWIQAFELLLKNRDLRVRMGNEARAVVEGTYSLQAQKEQLLSAICQAEQVGK